MMNDKRKRYSKNKDFQGKESEGGYPCQARDKAKRRERRYEASKPARKRSSERRRRGRSKDAKQIAYRRLRDDKLPKSIRDWEPFGESREVRGAYQMPAIRTRIEKAEITEKWGSWEAYCLANNGKWQGGSEEREVSLTPRQEELLSEIFQD
jgi:hypothetical protein